MVLLTGWGFVNSYIVSVGCFVLGLLVCCFGYWFLFGVCGLILFVGWLFIRMFWGLVACFVCCHLA